MLIKIKFKDDVPMSMAQTLIEKFHDHFALFGAADSMEVIFEDGEEERLRHVEDNPPGRPR